MFKTTNLSFFVFTILLVCFSFQNVFGQDNMLTTQEKQDGWKLLFNGKDLSGWHSFQEKAPGKAWQVENGAIVLNKTPGSVDKDFADLVTDDEYENFDLIMEWKMEPCSNSGLMFYVNESSQFHNTYESGPEMQIADLACNDDGRILKCRAGALYDLIPADTEWVNAGPQWNRYEIIADHGKLILIQNGHKIVQTTMWDDQWKNMIAHSKFTEWPGFGTFKKGHISFQGTENGKLWYRNIKIKEL